MKKFAVIVLAAVMLLSTLAGCGASAEGEASVQSVSMICGFGATGLVDRFAGMVTALAIILESFPIYLLGQSLKIYFSFVVVSLGCACYGPLVGMGVGAVIDTLGFLLSSYGEPYFPGYLITAMLSGLIYGVMLYQRKPTIPRLIVTRLLINYGSNVLLGSVWKAMLYGKGYLYYLSTGMVKNTIMIPIEVALMWLALNAAEKHGLDRRYLHPRR